jgi:hypothetical protein
MSHKHKVSVEQMDTCPTCHALVLASRASAEEAIAARDRANALPKPKDEITPEQLAKHLFKKKQRPTIDELM